MARKGKLRIGTSGYQYDHWKGLLYPEDVPATEAVEMHSSRASASDDGVNGR